MYLVLDTSKLITKAKDAGARFRPDELKAIDGYQKNLERGTRYIPLWVKLAVAIALGLGTMVGWRRIVKTVGERIGKTHLTYGMASAASRVRQARLGEIQARAQYKPVVNADANATDVKFSKNAGFATLARAFSGGGNSGPPSGVALPGDSIKTFAVGFDASWELDVFGGGRRGVEAALARTEAAEWNRRDAAVTLAAEVADAYFALRLDQEQIAVIESEIERQSRALQIASNIAKVGLTPSIDVTRQNGNITATRARLEPLKADLDVRKHALGVLVGQPPEALMGELSGPLPALVPMLSDMLCPTVRMGSLR